MQIRPCREADLKALRDLLVTVWHDTYDAIYGAERVAALTDRWHAIETLKAQLRRPNARDLVADDAGIIVGNASATFPDGRTVKLHRLYVHPSRQKEGVGAGLLRAVRTAFPEAEAIALEVEPANERAIAFYRKHGFTEAGQVADCGGRNDGILAIRMVKRFNPLTRGVDTRKDNNQLSSDI